MRFSFDSLISSIFLLTDFSAVAGEVPSRMKIVQLQYRIWLWHSCTTAQLKDCTRKVATCLRLIYSLEFQESVHKVLQSIRETPISNGQPRREPPMTMRPSSPSPLAATTTAMHPGPRTTKPFCCCITKSFNNGLAPS